MAEDVPSLEAFVDQLIETKEIPDLTDDHRSEMREDLLEQLEERINSAILEALPPSALENFNGMLDGIPDEQAVHDFIHQHIPNVGEVIAAELIRFRKEFLNED